MLSVQTIIRRIRTRCHDSDNITYTDEEILDAINLALRFIRRCIADMRPSLLMSKAEGTLEVGQSSIELEHRPLKVIHVTLGNKIIKSETVDDSEKVFQNYKQIWHNPTLIYSIRQIDTYREAGLKQTELAHVIHEDNDTKGDPKVFYLTGAKTINFYPIPDKKTKYSILYVEDIEELTAEDESPLLTEFDDFLIEYASIRLQVGNEYDLTQEQAMVQNIFYQIQKILTPPPVGFICNGYWNNGRRRRRDYGL